MNNQQWAEFKELCGPPLPTDKTYWANHAWLMSAFNGGRDHWRATEFMLGHPAAFWEYQAERRQSKQ